MYLNILNQKILSNIPSASGIECVKDKLFIVGDDSAWLFKLNTDFKVEEKIKIIDTVPEFGNKISKLLKPDFEAMTCVDIGEEKELLLFGSGSKSPERDVLVRCNTLSPYVVKKYSLVEFYKHLRTIVDLQKEELNIEAAVVIEKELFLFNRGKNIIIQLNANDFISYIENTGNIPSLNFYNLTLPSLNGIEAGFSGAASIPNSNQIVFTASIENTPNWIDDGEILGSFIGVFSLSELKNTLTLPCQPICDKEKNIIKIKVESVAVRHSILNNFLRLLLVTDNDSNSSELIEVELSF